MEIWGLQWSDISVDILSIERTITATNYKYNNGKDPKTENSRSRLYIPQYIVDLIDAYKKSLDIKSKWIFPNKYGKVTSPTAFKNFLDRIKEKHNIPHVTPHMFRHTFGSLLHNRGIDIATISDRLGGIVEYVLCANIITECQSIRSKMLNFYLCKSEINCKHPQACRQYMCLYENLLIASLLHVY